MAPVAFARIAIPLLTLGAAAALAWAVLAWMRRVRVRRRARATRGPAAVPPAPLRDAPAAASRPVDEPRAAPRGGWSLDLSDDP